jgi:hypothetical protein
MNFIICSDAEYYVFPLNVDKTEIKAIKKASGKEAFFIYLFKLISCF